MPRRTVHFAKISRVSQARLGDRDFRTDLLRAIDPENTVTRYGRTWRFSRPSRPRDLVLGKLGFTHEGRARVTEYDEDTQDFVTDLAPARQTSFSHFVIDTRSEVVAFEERGRDIRRQSFIGAFEGLLDVGGFASTVEPLPDPRSLSDWARNMSRVVRVRAVVRNPNPGWVRDAGAIRHIVEEAQADTGEIAVNASSGGSLSVEAVWIQGALQQISEEGQGTMTAFGIRGRKESRWASGQRVRTEVMDELPSDDSRSFWRRMSAMLRRIRGS